MTRDLEDLLSALRVPAQLPGATQLSEWLYENCYTRRYGSPLAAPLPSNNLTDALSAANASLDREHHGWIAVQMLEHGWLLARRAGRLRSFAPGEYLVLGRTHGLTAEAGDEVIVQTRRESLRVQPGMYVAFGEALSSEGAGTLRFYWNVRPESASTLLTSISRELNRFEIPFQFKCPRDAASFGRRDAAVLYVASRDRDLAARLVARIHAAGPDLDPDVPLFARRLAPGLGFAEDPLNGSSFGEHRCGLLAEALLAQEQDGGSAAERVAKRFEQEGLSLQRPWLNAGSKDLEWPPPPVPLAVGPRSTQGGFLDTAARIGARLCRDAIWHEDRCTWTTDANREDEVRHVAMGAGLYEGTSGVALFLARLAKASGDGLFAETARGAIRHAQRGRALLGAADLYSGEAGVLVASAEVFGESFDEDALLRSANRFAFAGYDLMGGEAGVIIPLLHAWRSSRNPELLALAVHRGDWLIEQAEPDEASGISWASDADGDAANLTGFSHGAAGIGWVLAELFGCCGERRFADAALDAFRYEREYFDEEEQNWPDFRDEEVTFGGAWCHGAPGIALSRLRALRLIPDCGPVGDDLRIGLETTRLTVYDNWCLCHGQGGNAEILRLAGMREAALRIAEEGVERFDRRRMPWPCWVVPDGPELPGLMTGLAGIGEFYLRMAGETGAPSPLLFIPDPSAA